MPMPSVTDLQTMYGSWNPQAYLEAQSNAGLERQFRESEYARQQELAKQASLDTLFRQQDDPNRVQERILSNRNRELTNEGLVTSNKSSGLDLERKEAMHKFNLDADQRKALMQITDDELKQADQVIEQLRRSLNPEDQKRGQQLFELTGTARALKAQRDEARALEEYKQGEETKRSDARNKTSIGVANINAASRTATAGTRGSTASPVALLSKLSPDKRLAPVRAILDSNIDPETKEPLTSAARAYYESMYEQDVRTLDAKPAPAGGIALQMGADGKPVLGAAPARPSVGNIPPTTQKPPVTKLSELQKMYPGKSEAELRAAYKKKFGVDLQ